MEDRKTDWQEVNVQNWYGQGPVQVEMTYGDAVWYHSGMSVVPIRWVLVRDPKGKFETKAFLCTDQSADPVQILKWFIRRWQVGVTFQEVRTHLGVETQRQWSDMAIARVTPILMALFSFVTLLAHQSQKNAKLPIRQAAWYEKTTPTFSDAIAFVRRSIWKHWSFCMSPTDSNMQKLPNILFNCFFEAVCYSV